jgi:galactose mutarotase-like enzyme
MAASHEDRSVTSAVPEEVALSRGSWTARIELLGAQLRSLAHCGRELLWPGDARWNKSAPLLFPVTGRLSDDALRFEGQSFAHPMHGLARESIFHLEQSSSQEALLSLDRAGDMRFPWDFRLEARYLLKEDGLELCLRVVNPSDHRELPFQIGWHPGFSWGEGPWRLRWDRPCSAAELEVVPGLGLRTGKESSLGEDLTEIVWKDRPTALVCRGLPGRTELWRHGTALAVSYDPPPVAWVLWSLPGAPFLCPEGWHGLPDRTGFAGDVPDREAILKLAPKASWELRCRVELLSEEAA